AQNPGTHAESRERTGTTVARLPEPRPQTVAREPELRCPASTGIAHCNSWPKNETTLVTSCTLTITRCTSTQVRMVVRGRIELPTFRFSEAGITVSARPRSSFRVVSATQRPAIDARAPA